MRRVLLALALLFVGFAVAVGRTKAPAIIEEHTASSSPPAETAKANVPAGEWHAVIRVVDGDTIVVQTGTTSEKVRLIGLDTPETVDPRKLVQCFGREASGKAHEALDGQSVRLEFDPSQGRLDKYGRTLAYVFLKDGTDFNELMIAEGYGHEYTYDLPYMYQTAFKSAEKKAREEKKGLWADDACAKESART